MLSKCGTVPVVLTGRLKLFIRSRDLGQTGNDRLGIAAAGDDHMARGKRFAERLTCFGGRQASDLIKS